MSVYTEAEVLLAWGAVLAAKAWMDCRTFYEQALLLSDNRAPCRRMWGAHDCTFTGEYRRWIWRFFVTVGEAAVPYFVLTGRQGTSVEFGGDLPVRETREVMASVLAVAVEGRIERSPGICGGSARVLGTRIPVWTLVVLAASSPKYKVTLRLIRVAYPELDELDSYAALVYAASARHRDELLLDLEQNNVCDASKILDALRANR